ncbi:MAG: serine/threonine-protein kinase [Mycobacteriales bacterium]
MRLLGSNYLLEEQLGEGANGKVWRGRHVGTGQQVAVKLLREELAGDPELVARFVRERLAMLSVRGPHVVRVLDHVVEGETLALVMPLLTGGDLRGLMRRYGRAPATDVARVGAEVFDGLASVHAAGIVHRDVKPENILVDQSTPTPTMLVSDFGVSWMAEAHALTQGPSSIGTPYYMAPEVGRGEPATRAADLYSAGCLLYELFAGHPPFQGEHVLAILRAHSEDPPARPAGCPDELWRLLSALLAKDPAARPTSTVAVRDQLATIAGLPAGTFTAPEAAPAPTPARPAAATPPSPPPDVPTHQPGYRSAEVPYPAATAPRRSRRGLLIAAVAAAVVVAAGGGALAFWPRHPGGGQVDGKVDGNRMVGCPPIKLSQGLKNLKPKPTGSHSPGRSDRAATDPKQLTMDDVFPPDANAIIDPHGTCEYDQINKSWSKQGCTGVVQGSRILPLVTGADCQQAMRATYVDNRNRWWVMETVFTLATWEDADVVVRTLTQGDGKQHIHLLHATTDDPIRQITITSPHVTTGSAFGRYAVLFDSGFVDGRRPTETDRVELQQARVLVASIGLNWLDEHD